MGSVFQLPRSAARAPFGVPNPPSLQPGANGYTSGACSAAVPQSEQLPHELYPYTFPPPTYQTFRPTAAIDMPAVSVTSTIYTLAPRLGWDAVILKIGHRIIGPGFVECDGSITWNLSINGNQPVPYFGQMISQFGSDNEPADISPGFILKSGQSLVYKVTNVSYAVGAAKAFCCIQGYYWRIQDGVLAST